MARVVVLGERHPKLNLMVVRGVFTQRKKLWDQLVNDHSDIEEMKIVSDMGEKDLDTTSVNFSLRIAKDGRTAICKDGVRMFQVIETNLNEIRGWDFDAEGNLVCNPITP